MTQTLTQIYPHSLFQNVNQFTMQGMSEKICHSMLRFYEEEEISYYSPSTIYRPNRKFRLEGKQELSRSDVKGK
jgi:hypothetical protein